MSDRDGSDKIAHLAKPGPLYWDWRCRACSEPVDDHMTLPQWWRYKLSERKAR